MNMRELSLFSGAGGGLLGSKLLGWRSVGYVEINEYCQKVLKARIDDGILDKAPIFTDVREFIKSGCAREYRGFVDVVTAGFPCQPFSVAGKQKGEDDERNMWPETLAVLRAVRPRFAFLENVPGLLAHEYIRRIFGDLAESGFNARWRVLSAAEVGAPHKRDRVWIVTDSNRNKFKQPCNRSVRRLGRQLKSFSWDENWEDSLCKFRRVDDGSSYRVERTDAIRNGQVPRVAATAWRLLNN